MTDIEQRNIAVEPECWRRQALVEAVQSAGAEVVPIGEASGLVWADPQNPQLLPPTVHDQLDWVQLPYAGVESFLDLLDDERVWTCGKGVYARPVAEAALAMLLAGFRNLVGYAQATSWEAPVGQNLHGANVLILGAGGITEELLPLLAPFETRVTVLRRRLEPFPGADYTATLNQLDDLLPDADAVILGLALTPETRHVIGARQLDLMSSTAWLINVARGGHVDTDALAAALDTGSIGGAAIDVTEPEPLPDGHRLWSLPNCLITPHVANTPEMGLALLAERVTENTTRYLRGEPLLGELSLADGY